MTTVHLDVETRSEVDLRKAGAAKYAADPSTDFLSMAFAFDDEPIQLWTPDDVFGDERLSAHIRDGGIVACHNANFESLCFQHIGPKYGLPPLQSRQLRCTMVRALAMALPASLEDAAPAAGLTLQKDTAGNRIMRKLSSPREVKDDGTVVWWTKEDVPDQFEKLYAYNIQDVEVERALDKRLLQLSLSEQCLWEIDHEINQRGVQIDVKAVTAAV